MKEEVVVNDTNILVDMHTAGLLQHLSESRLKFHTVDFVIAELEKSQYSRPEIDKLISKGILTVAVTEAEEMGEITSMHLAYSSRTNLSLVDCAVMLYAKKHGFRLLTGDKKLRNHAIDEGILVSGILWIVNEFLDEGLVSRNEMIAKLEKLLSTNPRLPKKLIQDKIDELRQAAEIDEN